MSNPLVVAVLGKGVLPFLSRTKAIASRYGFTAVKMDIALAELSNVLREFDCQGTFPVTSAALVHQPKIAQKYCAQGFELAVHGLTHIDYSRLSLEQQIDHFRRARRIFTEAGIPTVGFRCPYLRWNADTVHALIDCGFDYDSSQALAWDVAGEKNNTAYQRVMAFYGAQIATDYPALPRLVGNLVRIPYCLPDDEALVERLKIIDRTAMSEIWLAILERVYASGELFTLGIHPERALLCKDALWAVLAKARSFSPPVWIARLDEISAWFRSLGQSAFEVHPQVGKRWCITIHAPEHATILARSLSAETPGKAWGNGYVRLSSNELTFYGEQFPWIGLPPDSPASLKSFLQHQGYLVETSTNPDAFSCYIVRRTFQPEDEHSLLSEIETGTQPLLRLGRWPEGARAALAVTGDIDAFTLWDYGSRFFNH